MPLRCPCEFLSNPVTALAAIYRPRRGHLAAERRLNVKPQQLKHHPGPLGLASARSPRSSVSSSPSTVLSIELASLAKALISSDRQGAMSVTHSNTPDSQ